MDVKIVPSDLKGSRIPVYIGWQLQVLKLQLPIDSPALNKILHTFGFYGRVLTEKPIAYLEPYSR
jgi:hypothetical protein